MNDIDFENFLNTLKLLDAQQMEDLLRHLGVDFVEKRNTMNKMNALEIGMKLLQASEMISNRSGN
jgi:Leu/Phe-tRNA-protein transferase